MPLLPSRVPEKDPGGTQVQRSAWDLGARPAASRPAAAPAYRPRYPEVPTYSPPPAQAGPPPAPAGIYSPNAVPRSPSRAERRNAGGCWWSLIRYGTLAAAIGIIGAIAILVVGYFSVASTLPPI